MDLGIVNALELLSIDELDPELREASENVVLNKMENATEVMLDLTCESDFAARMHRNSPSERKSHEGTPNYNKLWGCDVKTDNITHVAQSSR